MSTPTASPANAFSSKFRHSTTHPKYLHSNSTSHKWAFGAIAELVDNSVDAHASELFIDVLNETSNNPLLALTDNGIGMSLDKVHRMLSFGHCSKVAKDGNTPIGYYGNGFKSGSMRLGDDALVFTTDGITRTVGFLSQTFLYDIDANEVLVPMATWNVNSKPSDQDALAAYGEDLQTMLKYGPFSNLEELNQQFDLIPSRTLR
eukprot:TRINITY_DN9062_c0_g1_i1.p1 TRINITY_DN9062_c0_g1~~TRINITY_DN9062_c0_g1_i1.p1  ORF type:complete len:204 (+),score=38.79 TRINITY_DN9062_c0_g1_i1:72-683(+)